MFKNTDITLTGYYTLVVNALTDPSKAIVSTNENVSYTNYNSIYKSNSIADLMVKDGKIAWFVSVADVNLFITEHVYNTNSAMYKLFNGITEGQETKAAAINADRSSGASGVRPL